jgi:hypothetical protein
MNSTKTTTGCDHLPDACATEFTREDRHLEHRRNKDGSWWQRVMERDKPLLRAIVVLVLCLNFSTGRYILYPFTIFSTWVHEMCHGIAAILMGGYISKLLIFNDGSGLAYTATTDESWKRGFVASAGYTGTALVGGFLLLFRRMKLGPTVGTICIGIAILLSCILYVRNKFGLIVLPIEGVLLVICGWFFRASWVGHLYAFLAATCSFNAYESIQELFQSGQGYVNGEVRNSDAHTVAEFWGGTYILWATWWLVFATIMSAIGIIFVIEPRVPVQPSTTTTTTLPTTTTTTTTYTKPSVFTTTTYQPPTPQEQQPQMAVVVASDWACPRCSLFNSMSVSHCKACGQPRNS